MSTWIGIFGDRSEPEKAKIMSNSRVQSLPQLVMKPRETMRSMKLTSRSRAAQLVEYALAVDPIL